jgi:hypothetical protein
MLSDFGCKFSKIPLLCDNESAIKLANNPVHVAEPPELIWLKCTNHHP